VKKVNYALVYGKFVFMKNKWNNERNVSIF
jgi:hypothetical protein